MPSTLELCEKYYGTRDVYVLFEISKDALEKDIKKAYYRLALKDHPDRVPESEKEDATEKFKVLTKLNEMLTDNDKRKLYDEKGIIDDDDDQSLCWLELWKQFFKPITTQDINNYEKEYIGSELEKTDIKKAYLNGKGCINYMMNCVPFMRVEDEPRIMELVTGWIEAEEVPEYTVFTKEPKAKKSKRHTKYAREEREAAEIKKKLNENSESLESQIMKRQSDRANGFGSLLDKLMEKYGDGEDDSDVVDFDKLLKKKTNRKAGPSKAKAKHADSKPKDRKVKSGRVTKSHK